MKLRSVLPTVALIAIAAFSIAAQNQKPAPHLFVYDLKTKTFVPLDAPDGAQIYVVGPSGIQPGIFAVASDDNKQILIAPVEMMQEDQTPDAQPPAQDQNPNAERMDHAELYANK